MPTIAICGPVTQVTLELQLRLVVQVASLQRDPSGFVRHFGGCGLSWIEVGSDPTTQLPLVENEGGFGLAK